MMNKILAAALPLCLAACSPEPVDAPEAAADRSSGGAPSAAAPATPAPAPSPAEHPGSAAVVDVLTLEGLGPLRIGQSVPAGWAERGAQISDDCRTVSSPGHPGVYAIVEAGKVRRITVGQRSDVKLIEGIGVGATENRVRTVFPGFREAPHEYESPPAKYLTAPNAAGGDPALRFEIGMDGKVSLIHVGTMPVLGYVEGCA